MDESFSSITSIQYIISAFHGAARGGNAIISIQITNESGTPYWAEDETVTVNSGLFATYSGTVRTTSDGSAAWTDGQLDNLRLEVTSIAQVGAGFIQQAYIKVTYALPSGYGNDVNGVAAANIGKINGVATADISKVNGV